MTDTRHGSSPHFSALIPRTIALLILLYQIRFLAADLADTPVFIAALAGGIFSAIFLCKIKICGRSVRPFQAVIILAMVPWVIRFFTALPRWFFPGVSSTAILLDSLLLNLDRNGFAALLPFYWLSITTYFSNRSRLFLRADIISADTFFLVLFSIARSSSLDVYRWPILMIALFILVFFLQILSLVLSTPLEIKLRRNEGLYAGVFLFLLVILGGSLFIRPFQEKAVEQGGGLLEPKLFRFDFSQVLRLESEISVNDDLVLIVRKESDDYHTLLRRYTLSGYNPKTGFYRMGDIDEAAHPQRLPNRPTRLPFNEIKNFRITEQDYFLVNFDSSAFIGMNMPVEIIPYDTWDASSFNSAYAVISHTSEVFPFELINTVRGEPGPENLSLSPEEYALYTDYGGDETIKAFALETIRSEKLPYWEQIQMVHDSLKYGEYRYSLKPGIASDGDQLKYFLFNSKKGYCTYYAFAFTLMLRSLGIPCRVAAGFFVDPSTEVFNYYPVRTNMAHAWAEVWFPGYGWIEYDPTSEIMAEGEEFQFSQGTPPELFERLMKEILDNRYRLKAKENDKNEGEELSAFGRKTFAFISGKGPYLVLFILAVLFLSMRSGHLWLSFLHKNKRKKTLHLWAHIKRRLALAGLGKSGAEAEWAKSLDMRINGIYQLYLNTAAARFAPEYSASDSLHMAEQYKLFCQTYSKAVPVMRRLLAWLLPPLALVIRKKTIPAAGMILLIILVFSFMEKITAQDRDNPPEYYADSLFDNALSAQIAENWERAIELLSTGEKAYPMDYRFSLSLGNLYYHRRLYHLAWDEYRKTEKIIPWDVDLLIQLASTAGYLNRNDESADYLERVLMLQNDNMEAAGNLAWMYFKLHRLAEGERLLLDTIERMGENSDIAMTLGTIYSDMFQYQKAKESYLRAIKGSDSTVNRLFSALAHYNLSILESRFYQFGLAYEQTNASLESMNRASGRLARGELFLRQMELPRALAEYQEAYGMDSSPLSKLNLAQVFLVGGRLEDSLLYINDCLKASDNSWMLNYGIDPIRYKRDIHEILKDTYKGLLEAEAFSCPDFLTAGSLKESLKSSFRTIAYKFRLSLHTHLFRKYSLLSADAYEGSQREEGYGYNSGTAFHIEALIQYYNALEGYPGRAVQYLRQARKYEEPLIPDSVPSYMFEEGRIQKNRELIIKALAEFDPIWERDMIANAFAELAGGSLRPKGTREERQDAAERLFAINRGAMLQNGVRLPVDLQITGTAVAIAGLLTRTVKAAALEPVHGGSPRYRLTLDSNGDGTVSCELYDGGRGTVLTRLNLPFPQTGKSDELRAKRAAFTRSLKENTFDAF